MFKTLPPRILRLLHGAGVAGLALVLLFLTHHAQGATAAVATDPSTTNSPSPNSPAASGNDSIFATTPHPFRLSPAPGRLPQAHGWLSPENAQVVPDHARDLIDATLGSCDGFTAQPGVRSVHPCGDAYDRHGSRIFDKQGRPVAEKPNFPAPNDAILYHVMSSNSAPPVPPSPHFSLSSLHQVPLAGQQGINRVYLIYPTQRPQVHESLVSAGPKTSAAPQSGAAQSQSNASPQNSAGNSARSLPAYTRLAFTPRSFTLEPGVVLANWKAPQQAQLAEASAPQASPQLSRRALVVQPRLAAYQPLPGDYQQLFNLASLPFDARALFLPMPRVSSWFASAVRRAGVAGDYSKSSSMGLLLAGDGSAYEPFYTTWATAGHTVAHARIYGGLVTETMMIVRRTTLDMNWGSTYGWGGGMQFLFGSHKQ